MRLLVFGGRGYNHGGTTFMALDHLRAQFGVEVIIHGAAPGADQLAGVYARANSGVSEDPYPADWDNLDAPGAVIAYRTDGKPYNRKAGFDRNQRMIDEGKPDMGLQFPGGAGTADMRRRLDKAGIPVIQVYPEPFLTEDWREICAAADFARREGKRVDDPPVAYLKRPIRLR